MRKNTRLYTVLTLFCAAVLFGMPLLTSERDEPSARKVDTLPAVSSATPSAATETTNVVPAAAAPAVPKNGAVDALKKETFTVLHADGKTIGTISCREFLIYTLAAEMLPSFEPEALKAQAVASYTYFCYERDREKENPQKALCGADFADTPVAFPDGYTAAYWKEKWGEKTFASAYEKLAAAVDAVAGLQITYRGKPILAAYHAISSGKTEVAETMWSAAYPYLQSVASADDKRAPDYITTVRVNEAEFRDTLSDLKGIDLSSSPERWVSSEATRSAAGTVLKLTVGSVALTGREWRSRFGLRSACFSVAYENGGFTFTVRGYGHGVGMSQYGAQFAALDGASFEEILHRYYTDVTIQ